MRALVSVLALVLLASACGGDDGDGSVAADRPDAAAVADTASEPLTEPTIDPATTDPEASPTPPPPEDDPPSVENEGADELFPDVLAAEARSNGDGTWTFSATLSSPYDTPERYADAWRVLDRDGNELGVRILTHDHANEQPFTRSLNGVEIPDDVDVVTIEGRDQVSGWGGATVEVTLER